MNQGLENVTVGTTAQTGCFVILKHVIISGKPIDHNGKLDGWSGSLKHSVYSDVAPS
jgi:hypothetical protein